MRLKRKGDPNAPSRRGRSLEERFHKYLGPQDPVTGCIEWEGCRTPQGYGQISLKGGIMLTHRVAWELKQGTIPMGLNVLHKCDNPSCCNEEHLFLGTHADNMADKVAKGRQARIQGAEHCRAKLTEADVLEIRRLRSVGKSHGKIATSFKVSLATVKDINVGRSWAHLK